MMWGVLMARRGCKRRLETESEYWRLVLSGLGTVEACRLVGIGRKTGHRWRAENWLAGQPKRVIHSSIHMCTTV
jgi:hypothetical protein